MTGKHSQRKTLWLGLGLATSAAIGFTMWQRQRARLPSPLRQARDNRTALVTGASSGIGASYARQLARAGYNLILVARREARLQALAEELTREFAVQAEVLVADLADPADVAKVEVRIAEVESLDFLVNNAGFGTPGTFAANDIASQEAMIRVHVLAAVRLTRAALPGMMARHCGAIVNVASFVAFFPVTGSVTYSATKAYLKSFSEALYQELAGTGVRIQALCPGFTRTEFQDANNIDKHGVPAFAWMSADAVVAQSLRDLQADRAVSVPGAAYRLLATLAGVIPHSLLYHVGQWIRRYRDAAATPFGGFHKRTYPGIAEFLDDARYMLRQRAQIHTAMQLIAPAFRERLMLAVTQVNACRYCADFHVKLARKNGLPDEEIQQLLEGVADQCPPEEITAILYAREWAEAAGHPDAASRQVLIETYGAAQAAAIEMILRMINTANLAGNTFDAMLYRISGRR